MHPLNDLATINDELRLKDIERLGKLLADRKSARVVDKAKKAETEVLEQVYAHLEDGKWINEGMASEKH